MQQQAGCKLPRTSMATGDRSAVAQSFFFCVAGGQVLPQRVDLIGSCTRSCGIHTGLPRLLPTLTHDCEGGLQATMLLPTASTTTGLLENGQQGASRCFYATALLPVACCRVREVSLQDAGGRLTALRLPSTGLRFAPVRGRRYGLVCACALACVLARPPTAGIMHGTG